MSETVDDEIVPEFEPWYREQWQYVAFAFAYPLLALILADSPIQALAGGLVGASVFLVCVRWSVAIDRMIRIEDGLGDE